MLTECNNPRVMAARELVQQGAPGLITKIINNYRTYAEAPCHPHASGPRPQAPGGECPRLPNWDDPDGKYLLFQLLTATPWSSRAAGMQPIAPAVWYLGCLFEAAVPDGRMRPHRQLCTEWVKWANTSIKKCNAARIQALRDADTQ